MLWPEAQEEVPSKPESRGGIALLSFPTLPWGAGVAAHTMVCWQQGRLKHRTTCPPPPPFSRDWEKVPWGLESEGGSPGEKRAEEGHLYVLEGGLSSPKLHTFN